MILLSNIWIFHLLCLSFCVRVSILRASICIQPKLFRGHHRKRTIGQLRWCVMMLPRSCLFSGWLLVMLEGEGPRRRCARW